MKRVFLKFGIKDKKSFIEFSIEFFKFGIVGLSNTIISLSIYYLFLLIDNNWYMIGNLIGWVVSVFNSFFWNNKFVFKTENKNLFKLLAKTYISYGLSFILSSIFLFIQINFFSIDKKLAPIINLIITIPFNFIINKFWTFK